MSEAILVSMRIIWIFLIFIFMLILAAFFPVFMLVRYRTTDKIIIIDQNNRWRLFSMKLFGKNKFNMKEKTYFLKEDAALISEKGKSLFIFSENKTQPIKITYNKAAWLDSESLKNLINNNLLQLMLKANKKQDFIIILGAIGGAVAGLASVLTLLIVTGVFK